MIRTYQDTNFVTGLRAYAALAVVLIHCGGAGLRSVGAFGNSVADLGATGVYVFFVISGFSVSASYQSATSIRSFLIRRIFRLAPVYYVFLLIAMGFLAFGATEPNHWSKTFDAPVDAYNILMHVSFLGFVDYRINNSMIGVEWSLCVEMFWYLTLPPILAILFRRPRMMLVMLGASLAIFFIQKSILRSKFGPEAEYLIQWSPLTFAPAFMMGVAAYLVRQTETIVTKGRSAVCLALAFSLVGLQCFVSFMEIRLLIPLVTFLMLVGGSDQHGVSKLLLNNRAALYLGTISYSIYLWHHLVIEVFQKQGVSDRLGTGLAMFSVVSLVTIVLSAFTYRWLEVPSNYWGRRLAKAKLPLMPSWGRSPLRADPVTPSLANRSRSTMIAEN